MRPWITIPLMIQVDRNQNPRCAQSSLTRASLARLAARLSLIVTESLQEIPWFSSMRLMLSADMGWFLDPICRKQSRRKQQITVYPKPKRLEHPAATFLQDFCVSFWILLVLVLDQGRPKSKVLRSRWQVLPVWLGIWSFRNLFFCRIGPLVSRIFHPRWTRTRPIGTVAPTLAKWSHYVSLSYHHEQEIGGRPRLKTLDTGAPMQPSSAWGKPYV